MMYNNKTTFKKNGYKSVLAALPLKYKKSKVELPKNYEHM